ncbi:hypothetical protein P3T76_011970 [Phytophthora citrophthora]|uniref:Uncharacterized protein n=2 Tax=Phytophthora citrophthora TaxID=4793 RepID=A0AAD9LEX7_9STRA|nr:hypothetical protein P3T76_011970 [Phytophthora citrophthora]
MRARLAQSVERKTLNLVVVGSSPTLVLLDPTAMDAGQWRWTQAVGFCRKRVSGTGLRGPQAAWVHTATLNGRLTCAVKRRNDNGGIQHDGQGPTDRVPSRVESSRAPDVTSIEARRPIRQLVLLDPTAMDAGQWRWTQAVGFCRKRVSGTGLRGPQAAWVHTATLNGRLTCAVKRRNDNGGIQHDGQGPTDPSRVESSRAPDVTSIEARRPIRQLVLLDPTAMDAGQWRWTQAVGFCRKRVSGTGLRGPQAAWVHTATLNGRLTCAVKRRNDNGGIQHDGQGPTDPSRVESSRVERRM